MAQMPFNTRVKLWIAKAGAYLLNTLLIAAVVGGIGLLIWGSVFGLNSGGLIP
ncbi:MAG: hypothetical protein U0003_04900 [Vampirovibrionales bacterium]